MGGRLIWNWNYRSSKKGGARKRAPIQPAIKNRHKKSTQRRLVVLDENNRVPILAPDFADARAVYDLLPFPVNPFRVMPLKQHSYKDSYKNSNFTMTGRLMYSQGKLLINIG